MWRSATTSADHVHLDHREWCEGDRFVVPGPFPAIMSRRHARLACVPERNPAPAGGAAPVAGLSWARRPRLGPEFGTAPHPATHSGEGKRRIGGNPPEARTRERTAGWPDRQAETHERDVTGPTARP